MQSKEREIHGSWMTEEKMRNSGEFSEESIQSIVKYCRRFPQTLVRKWKYDGMVDEYFVETETKAIVRQSELIKIREEKEREADDTKLHTLKLHSCACITQVYVRAFTVSSDCVESSPRLPRPPSWTRSTSTWVGRTRRTRPRFPRRWVRRWAHRT
ncbi:unnamed protein product [Symbiodinium sp. CCMP2592]|nr:unnamed protein product [Symbiodinium sp. CCMP2592]